MRLSMERYALERKIRLRYQQRESRNKEKGALGFHRSISIMKSVIRLRGEVADFDIYYAKYTSFERRGCGFRRNDKA